MKLGPVASNVKDLIEFDDFLSDEARSYSSEFLDYIPNKTVISKADVNEKVFSQTDLEALNFVFSKFSQFNAIDLAKYTHKFPEWNKFEDSLNAGALSREMSYLDFFDNPIEGDDFFEESKELLEANKENVKEDTAISEIFT
jgi:hypothetical protein